MLHCVLHTMAAPAGQGAPEQGEAQVLLPLALLAMRVMTPPGPVWWAAGTDPSCKQHWRHTHMHKCTRVYVDAAH